MIRATASATTDIHCSPFRAPSAKLTLAGAAGASTARRAVERVEAAARDRGQPGACRRGGRRRPRARPAPSRRARRRSAKEPKQTRPVPGSLTSSRTTARAVVSAHHLSASAKRVAPGGADLGGDAPADQALAPAQPGDRARRRAAGRAGRPRRRGRARRSGRREGTACSPEVALVVTRREPTPGLRDPGIGRQRPVDDHLVADLHLVEQPGDAVVVAHVDAAVRGAVVAVGREVGRVVHGLAAGEEHRERHRGVVEARHVVA